MSAPRKQIISQRLQTLPLEQPPEVPVSCALNRRSENVVVKTVTILELGLCDTDAQRVRRSGD